LSVFIYALIIKGKSRGDLGFADRVRPAAVSLSSNLAAGDERDTDKESVRFFYLAKGSRAEISRRL